MLLKSSFLVKCDTYEARHIISVDSYQYQHHWKLLPYPGKTVSQSYTWPSISVQNYSVQRREFLIIELNPSPNKFCPPKKHGKKGGEGGESEKVVLPVRNTEKHCTYFNPVVVGFPTPNRLTKLMIQILLEMEASLPILSKSILHSSSLRSSWENFFSLNYILEPNDYASRG